MVIIAVGFMVQDVVATRERGVAKTTRRSDHTRPHALLAGTISVGYSGWLAGALARAPSRIALLLRRW